MDNGRSFDNNRARYLVEDFYQDTNAKVLHFNPQKDGRDEFGNRVFTSKLSYYDADMRPVKAHMLVSVDGQKLISDNPGILKTIDSSLLQISLRLGPLGDDQRKVSDVSVVSGGLTISQLGSGNQSEAMLMELKGKKYVIKTNKSLSRRFDRYSQPYTNEMLQIQAVQKAFASEFKTAGVFIPKILFATGHMSCSEYVQGKSLKTTDDRKIRELVVKVFEYVYDHNKAGDALWKDVHLDWNNDFGNGPTRVDLIDSGSGIAWVDLFYHKWVN